MLMKMSVFLEMILITSSVALILSMASVQGQYQYEDNFSSYDPSSNEILARQSSFSEPIKRQGFLANISPAAVGIVSNFCET